MTLIQQLTLEELKNMIDEAVERKFQQLLGKPDARSLDEIFESIEQHRWSPPAGSKSTLELLREDRDR